MGLNAHISDLGAFATKVDVGVLCEMIRTSKSLRTDAADELADSGVRLHVTGQFVRPGVDLMNQFHR
jgi:hypothetical protein